MSKDADKAMDAYSIMSNVSDEERAKCFEYADRMMHSLDGLNAEKRLMFGSIGLIAEFLFDTYYESDEEKLKAVDEWSAGLKNNLVTKN